ncbi:aminoglycoside phosphotransferase family protein [Polyangium sp. 15x6]|uniref:aminoglycoside phosphotransferase family protein n=1 Tax=Polyangium sp. 15x6 TaxID=3042687 RepID=UPI00249CD190|nr:aminoglycoside phosphotransferase family protein [Polyangium sp. 15x6]MDI3281948.1 aminoglycoside phosphotransferase family protein [Polyangium sp. 15x6]
MTRARPPEIEDEIHELVAGVMPGAAVLRVSRLGPDEDDDGGATGKAIGYGVPLRIRVRRPDGAESDLCLHTAGPDEFGHDRRADRAANMLLAFDTFPKIPRHVRALDVGAVLDDGRLASLRRSGEFYLVTEYVEGHVYADDLRRIARERALSDRDVARCEALARLCAEVHAVRKDGPATYRRAIRDLLGHGEGIFGLVDGYPDGVPMAPPERLFEIEKRCLSWRWKLKGRGERLRRTHGDFHPFNVLFDRAGEPRLLDTSRGSAGDPADDVTCLSINYLFFALEAPGSWHGAFRTLWRTFFRTYLDVTGDRELFSVAAPFLAWRALVLCNPRWYPSIHASTRDALLGFVERVLDAPWFDPDEAEGLFS